MPNPINSTNLTLSEEDYNRLKKIKLANDWSFNETIDKLCELEFQHNYIQQVYEYSLVTENTSRLFKVTFKKDNMVVEYYNPDRGYDIKIANWELDKKTEKKFFEFIHEDYARCMLEYLPVSIEFEDFIIVRIN